MQGFGLLGSWNKFQLCDHIAKLNLSVLVNTLPQGHDETCSTASASLDLVNEEKPDWFLWENSSSFIP